MVAPFNFNADKDDDEVTLQNYMPTTRCQD